MDDMTGLLAQHGLSLVFTNVLLTQAGAPLPSTPTLIVAGALIAQGQLGLAQVLAVATIATLLGNAPWYFAGRRYGHRILRTVCRISLEPDSCVQRTEDVFDRWGTISLIVGKNIPGFATIAPPLAGAMRVGFMRFMGYTAISALLWAVLPLLVGWIFSTEVEWLLLQLEDLGLSALIVIAAVVAVYVISRSIERFLLIRLLRTTRIDVTELGALMEQDAKPVILDVRSRIAQKLEPRRLPGAIPVDMSAPQVPLVAVPPDRDVVVYCS